MFQLCLNSLLSGILSMLPDKIYSIGSDIVEGLWNGIGDMVGGLVPSAGTSVVNNYYNNDNSRTVNQTNNSPKALSRLEIYRLTRNAVNV